MTDNWDELQLPDGTPIKQLGKSYESYLNRLREWKLKGERSHY
jgi:hypothetical protein